MSEGSFTIGVSVRDYRASRRPSPPSRPSGNQARPNYSLQSLGIRINGLNNQIDPSNIFGGSANAWRTTEATEQRNDTDENETGMVLIDEEEEKVVEERKEVVVVEKESESVTLNDLEFKEPKGSDAFRAAER